MGRVIARYPDSAGGGAAVGFATHFVVLQACLVITGTHTLTGVGPSLRQTSGLMDVRYDGTGASLIGLVQGLCLQFESWRRWRAFWRVALKQAGQRDSGFFWMRRIASGRVAQKLS